MFDLKINTSTSFESAMTDKADVLRLVSAALNRLTLLLF